MSQSLHENIDVPDTVFDDRQYPPDSAQNQVQGSSNFIDGSGAIFLMYLDRATEEDKKMAENWKADANGILIFSGLFSVAVALLISVSIQDIRQNPQDASNFYLANIYQATINSNGPNNSSSLPASPPQFSPPIYAIWVNSLWFLSFVMSLTCALLATLLQQWARRYLKVTQVPYSQHKRALIRAFFAEGVEECLLPWVVETLPALLHISLFLFFAGLVVFLWNVNLTMFKSVLSWVTICSTLYGCFTLMPIFRHNSPYFTPLSSLMWGSAIGLAFLVSAASGLLLRYTFFCRRRSEWVLDFGESCYCLLSKGMQKTAEEAALKSPSAIVTRALMWTFEHLDEDHELERFFSGLPGLRSSKVIDDPLPRLAEEERQRFSQELSGLMGRTFSSDLPAPVKERRAMICAKAIDPIHFPKAFSVLDGILSKFQHSGPLVPRIVQVMREWGDHTNAISVAKATMSSIVARAQRRDKLWFILASDVLGIPETLLRDHAAHGDNLSFTILIHVTRQQFEHFWDSSWPRYDFSSVLVEASKFNIQDTSPELQHEFCALWNQVVRTVQDNGDRRMALYTLAQIRDVYIAIHQNTDSALTRLSVTTDWDGILTSYPVCNVPDHRDHPDSTPRLHDEAVPPPDNYISPPGPAQTSPQSLRVLSSSPNPVITHATRRSVDTLPRTTYLSSPERVASAPRPPPKSKASTSFPLYDVAVEHTPVSGTLLGDLSIPLSASPSPGSPVLDDIPIEYRSWDICAAVVGDDGANAASCKATERDVLHEDIMVTPDVPSQSLSN